MASDTGLRLSSDRPEPVTAADQTPRSGWETGGLRRFSALDGVRALAVLAVIFYHAGISWVGGGLLGVDVFFVLSGFLITSLLCRELARSGSVRLGRFWAQRARRLLPALFILLIGVALYSLLFRDAVDLSYIRGDALSTLLYVANWHFTFADQGYFAQNAAPSPLLHTWSLAVEEQYYLIWPLITLFVVRRFGARALAMVSGSLALGSAALMGVLFAAGVSVDRLYYGTDTRAQALLVGSFLGAIGAHRGSSFSILPEAWSGTQRRRQFWTLLGWAGFGYLVWAWHSLDGQDPSLYHGGFLVVAIAAGAVIVGCVTVPASLLARFLSLRAMVFIGRISYGLYLYHWPIFLTIDHAHTGLSGIPLLAVRLLLTFVVAVASFRFVEEPIRTRRMFRGRRAVGLTTIVASVMVVVILAATTAPPVEAAPLRVASLPPAERQALSASGALGQNPIKFLMLGDSVALTFARGLGLDSGRDYGVKVLNAGALGCDLDGTKVRLGGKIGAPTSGCFYWPSRFRGAVHKLQPDVVGILIGRWEVSDHYWNGHWVHVGDPAWDQHLLEELVYLTDVVSSNGAKVVFFTCPFVQPQEALNGSTFPENDPARITAWNRLLEQAVALRSGTATVVDLNKLLDPHGHYQEIMDGYIVRWSDGVHITLDGGALVQGGVMPTVVRLGLDAPARARALQP